ncbi:hypothetical protein [Pseudogemmobacter bohemicus]|uniref:hypothetical protein n=1 Tax=Pseudogemmobacter bohemicus TaxID=2250708 RepID=UPI0013005D6E|nr:hypothetical protein [Pseudogemmobacter bohemicus]
MPHIPRRRVSGFAAIVAFGALLAGQAAAFDMRDCPLDRVIFVDAWSKTRFAPERIGLDVYYACGPQEALQDDSPGVRSDCYGPYGNIILQGSYPENGDEGHFTAVYSLLKGTSPCCGWSVYPTAEAGEIEAATTWLNPGEAPKLGDWPFGGITNAWGSSEALDGLVALICRPEIS